MLIAEIGINYWDLAAALVLYKTGDLIDQYGQNCSSLNCVAEVLIYVLSNKVGRCLVE